LSSGGTTGTQIEVDAYYPFGRVMTASPQANFKVSRQFTGQVKDDDTGLCFYNTRYYDPLLDRFIQADTMIPDLGNPQSYNRYSYCLNNPLKYTDPSGHETKTSWYQDLGTIFGSWFASPPQKANDTQISLRTAALGNTENIMPAMASKSVEMTGQAVQTVAEQYVGGKALQAGGAAVSKMGGAVLSKVTGAAGDVKQATAASETTTSKLLAPYTGFQPWVGEVRSVTAAQDTTMYRVWGGDSRQVGSWLSPVPPTSAAAATESLALPAANTAQFYSKVLVPAGTRYQIGTAAAANGLRGGGVQVQLLQEIPKANFGSGIPLPPH
jgi:RHS repeat-associated protein